MIRFKDVEAKKAGAAKSADKAESGAIPELGPTTPEIETESAKPAPRKGKKKTTT